MHIARILFFLILMLSVSSVSGQFKNMMLDEQTDDENIVCDPAIAINPRHPDNMVAGSSPDNIYYTKDGGKTWQKSTLSSPFGVGGDPAIISDSKGNFYYFHLSDPGGESDGERSDRIVTQTSNDGGEMWSPLEAVGLNHPSAQDKEWAAVDSKGNLYVAWTQFDKHGDEDAKCSSNVLFSTSKNGKKWSLPVKISQLPGNCLDDGNTTSRAVPAAFDGKVFLAWSNQGKIFLDRSFNGGHLWLNNDIKVADQKGGWNLEIPGHPRGNGMPVLMIDNSKSSYRGSLYVVWADKSKGEDDADIWFTRSHNFGDNWTTPLRINDDEKGKHQYMPWMTVDPSTGYIYMIYYDRRNYDDHQTDVYLAYSTNGGTAFKNVLISERSFTPQDGKSPGDYNNISAQKGVIAPVWTRVEDGKTSVWTTIIRHEDLVKVED